MDGRWISVLGAPIGGVIAALTAICTVRMLRWRRKKRRVVASSQQSPPIGLDPVATGSAADFPIAADG